MRTQELAYAGTALASTTTYYWRIKFWDDDNFEGAWSTETARFSLAGAPITSTDVIQDIDFDYDAVGNLVQITDSSKTMAAKTTIFAYDDLYRLTSASTTAATTTPFSEIYTYSSTGNLLSKTGEGSYTYGEIGYANPHAATAVGSTTLAYDNNDNLISAGSWGYGWDYRNRLTSVGSGSATSTYGYDYLNQRVTKFVSSATSTYPNRYFNTNGTTSTKHIFAGDELVATITTTGATSTTQYIHGDHLGSTNAITNQDGDLYESIDYLPYGQERIHTGGFDEQRTFIQQESDSESQLSYLNARYYDGIRGQFLSEDPSFLAVGDPKKLQDLTSFDQGKVLSNPQGLNSYSYANGNPTTNSDPTGRYVEFSITGIAPGQSFSTGLRFDTNGVDYFMSGGAGYGGGGGFEISWAPGQSLSHERQASVSAGVQYADVIGGRLSQNFYTYDVADGKQTSNGNPSFGIVLGAGGGGYTQGELSAPVPGLVWNKPYSSISDRQNSMVNSPTYLSRPSPNQTSSSQSQIISNLSRLVSQLKSILTSTNKSKNKD